GSGLLLFYCCDPCCMRNEKCSLSSSPSSLFSASTSLARNSFAFIWTSCRPPGSARDGHARNNDRAQRQLRRGEPEGLAGEFFADSVHFVEHLARLDLRDVELGVPLALAHPDLGRLLGNRLVRKDPDPHPTATLDVAGHGAPRGLDLAGRQAAPADRLQPVLTEGNEGAAGRETLVAAFLFLAVLASFGLQHLLAPHSPAFGASAEAFRTRRGPGLASPSPAAGAAAPSGLRPPRPAGGRAKRRPRRSSRSL